MRKFGLFVFLFSAAIAASAAVFLPETSAEQLTAAPLERGQAVWAEAENGLYATAYIGGDAGKPLIVRDPAALHGFTPTSFAADRYAILPTGDFTVSGNEYKLAGGAKRGTIEIVVADGTPIWKLRHSFEDESMRGNREGYGLATNTVHISGNRATITMISGGAADNFYFNDLLYLPPGQAEVDGREVGNSVETVIPVQFYGYTNELWTLDLHKWPKWLLHYWDGNRGEHWANWPAVNTVMMGREAFLWDNYDLGERDGKLELNARGVPLVHFIPGAANLATNGWSLAFTSITTDPAAHTVSLTWRLTAPAGKTIDTNLFTVVHSPMLPFRSQSARNVNHSYPFRAVPAQIKSVQRSGNTATVTAVVSVPAAAKEGFFRVRYIPDPAANLAKFTATIEAPAIRVADASCLSYALGEARKSGGAYAIADRTVAALALAAGETNAVVALPPIPAGRVADLILDVSNGSGAAADLTVSGAGEDFAIAFAKGTKPADMLHFAAGARARLYFTLTAFTSNALPVWQLSRQDIAFEGEN